MKACEEGRAAVSKERDLILPAIPAPGGTWAELGSGSGIFTLVLLEVAGAQITLYSIDRDAKALDKQRRAVEQRFPQANVTYLQADFTTRLQLPPLDGILAANSLHYVRFDDQPRVVKQIAGYLKPGGKLIIVEYESQRGNPWVPYPIDFESFQYLAGEVGLRDVRRLALIPSTFMHAMYSAVAFRPEETPHTLGTAPHLS
jgi:ubiquinone/menaquinone biosynthesis C-methylase UbiE